MRALAEQASLFGSGEPRLDAALPGLRRVELGAAAWVDHLPGWLEGHEALFEALRQTTRWRHHRRRMYERVVDVPRLIADLPGDGPGHPVLDRAAAALVRRYGLALDRVSLAYYRDGRDSVAWHGDRLGRLVDDTVVAILSVGAPRRFLLRPTAGGVSRAFDLGWGDLLVMGGSCQRTWQHAVPKAVLAGPRISVQFRPDVDDAQGRASSSANARDNPWWRHATEAPLGSSGS
jgi:alkylated DNA repair dioxygenase AlkB